MNPGSHARRSEAAIQAFLRDATRFDPGEIRFYGARSVAATCAVAVHYDIAARLLEDTVAGHAACGDADVAAGSEAQYAAVCAALLSETGGRFDLLRALGARIGEQPYGAHTRAFEFHRSPRRALLVHDCVTCGGSGSVRCGHCGGAGSESCGSCGGSGSRTETSWTTDHKGDSVSETHSVSCSSCLGGSVSCSGCHGSGSGACGGCAGSGRQTRIGTPVLATQPDYRLARIDPAGEPGMAAALAECAGLARLEQQGVRLTGRSVRTDEENRRIREDALFSCEFSSFDVATGAAAGRVLTFGDDCRIAEVGPLVETMVRGDLDMLRAATACLRRFDMPALRHAQRLAALVMQSEVHQATLAHASVRADNTDAGQPSAGSLVRTLSPDYRRETLGALEQVVRWTSASHAWIAAALGLGTGTGLAVRLSAGGHPVAGAAAAVVAFILAGALRWEWTWMRLRALGGSVLVDFAASRGIRRRFAWTW